MSNEDIHNLLFSFYPSIRKVDRDNLKLNYLKSIHYGISVYLKTLGYNTYSQEFERSKKSYEKLKKICKGGVDHKFPLPKEDMKTLYTNEHTFDTTTPVGL